MIANRMWSWRYEKGDWEELWDKGTGNLNVGCLLQITVDIIVGHILGSSKEAMEHPSFRDLEGLVFWQLMESLSTGILD